MAADGTVTRADRRRTGGRMAADGTVTRADRTRAAAAPDAGPKPPAGQGPTRTDECPAGRLRPSRPRHARRAGAGLQCLGVGDPAGSFRRPGTADGPGQEFSAPRTTDLASSWTWRRWSWPRKDSP